MRRPRLPFPDSEYRARLTRVRDTVARLGLDALLIHSPENTYYLTGLRSLGYSIYQTLLVPLSGEPAFVTRAWEAMTGVPGTSNIRHAAGYRDTENPLALVQSLLAERGLGKATIGIDLSSRNLTAFQFSRLRRLCRPARFVDCSGLVESVRLIKSPAEIGYLRQSARAGLAAVRAWERAVRPGATELELAAAVYGALLSSGSEYPGYPPFICSGERAGWAHSTWDRRTLRRGDVAFIEVSGCVMRYHAPLARTTIAGARPGGRLGRMRDAVDQALRDAVSTLRPGVRSGEVHATLYRTIERAGFEPHIDRNAGYSVGIAFPPTWSEARTMPHYARRSRLAGAGIDGRRFYLSRDNPTRLEAGMVFHVFPTIMFPGVYRWGTSATIAVTADGVEILAGPEWLAGSAPGGRRNHQQGGPRS